MNYREMSIKDGAKYPGFWWYALVEILLLVWALVSLANSNYMQVLTIFILIELREINCKMKGA